MVTLTAGVISTVAVGTVRRGLHRRLTGLKAVDGTRHLVLAA